MELPFSRVAVLGTGLVGGSFALALKRAFPQARVIGCDRPKVLERARERGAFDEPVPDAAAACRGADLVYLALPVLEIVRALPTVAAVVSPTALVTDAGSTKTLICQEAERVFPSPRRFVGGHPLAGRESGGIESAAADLFAGAPYFLIGAPEPLDDRLRRLLAVIEAIGARPVWLAAGEHDRLAAFLSHLPQMVAVALAETVLEGAGESAGALAGPGLRDTLRLAGSPYAIWADVARTNPHLPQALDRLGRWLERIRSRLESGDLREDFERSNRLYKILRRLE
ncbi:MAG TPA: prephenate dehydrogenase/arogenate dehydrogenase family protein [Candidatus Acidoferrales bacterium]|nr:prephenate dehydrogenase/arogenate dehydrogenase family protein [Candidatus Acidoferrales bacterium]